MCSTNQPTYLLINLLSLYVRDGLVDILGSSVVVYMQNMVDLCRGSLQLGTQ